MTPSRQVFVVDDDAAVCISLCRLLRSAGYQPEGFSSARKFMEQYRGAPGCLLLDISMPEMTGIELHGWLAHFNSPLPVVFLTGRADLPSTVLALKNGAVNLLKKPVGETTLLKALDEALRRDAKNRAAQAGQHATLATPRPDNGESSSTSSAPDSTGRLPPPSAP